MRRIDYTFMLTLSVSIGACPALAQQSVSKPDIVLILLDDIGYSDFGRYGSEINTPNMDRLAENSIRLCHFHNQAWSTPTRASLITGLYPHQVGNDVLGKVPGYLAYQGYSNESNVLLSEALRMAGYFNVMTGKRHLGYFQGVTPISRGSDHSLNAPFGGCYFSSDKSLKENKKERTDQRNLYLNDGEIGFDDDRLPENRYSTHLWADFGLKFTDEATEEEQSSFRYLARNATHFPLQAPVEAINRYKGKYVKGWEDVHNARFRKQLELGLFERPDQLTLYNPKAPGWDLLTQEEKERYDVQMVIYVAVIEGVDRSIGRAIEHLKEKGVLNNTLIILLSDDSGNGESGIEGRFAGENPGSAKGIVFLGAAWADVVNVPPSLYKHHGHEGGCNIPFIAFYPNGTDKSLNGIIQKDNYGHIVNIILVLVKFTGTTYPSLCGDHKVPPMEDISLLPLLKGELVKQTKPTVVEHEDNKVLRDRGWKVVWEYREPKWRLYNLKNDPTEIRNLADREPEILNRMIRNCQKMADHIGVESEIEFKIDKWYAPVERYLG